MLDWWIADLEIFKQLRLTPDDFYEMVNKAHLCLRFGVLDMLKQAEINDVPLIVVSGGIKEVIDTTFDQVLDKDH
jgi:2-hydroxy-3-keto-5-methylthiopentenyl-1-phosphate phosphatase